MQSAYTWVRQKNAVDVLLSIVDKTTRRLELDVCLEYHSAGTV